VQTFFCLSCYLIKMHCFRTGDTAEIIYFSTVYHLYLTQMIRIPFHFDAYPYLPFTMIRIRIRPVNLIWIRIQILPLTFSQIWTLQCSKMTTQGFYLFTLMRIRLSTFNADPDPASQNDANPCGSVTLPRAFKASSFM